MIPKRIQRIHHDESGFAIIIAVALTMLIAIVAVALTSLVMGEDSNSRRDQAQDGSYQAAEAGTNAYLTDLTESTGAFYTAYMAKGEATRTDSSSVTHANNCTAVDSNGKSTCSDATWNWASWGTTWTYATSRTADTGWYSMGNGYQYLIQVYPPSLSLSNGLAQVITRIDVTGRPAGSTDLTRWRTIETMLRPSSLADFQAFSATDLSYGSGATTTGPIFVGENSSGTTANLSHAGTAKANLYAEGTVTVTGTLASGAKKYDKTTTPTALCKLNNCTPVPFSNFSSTFSDVAGAASCPDGHSAGRDDNTNPALSSQGYPSTPGSSVPVERERCSVSSCKKYSTGGSRAGRSYDRSTTAPAQQRPSAARGVKSVPSQRGHLLGRRRARLRRRQGQGDRRDDRNVVWTGQTTYNSERRSDVLGVEAHGNDLSSRSGRPTPATTSPSTRRVRAQRALRARIRTGGGSASGTLNFYGSTAVYGTERGTKVCRQQLHELDRLLEHVHRSPLQLRSRTCSSCSRRSGRTSATPSRSSSQRPI